MLYEVITDSLGPSESEFHYIAAAAGCINPGSLCCYQGLVIYGIEKHALYQLSFHQVGLNGYQRFGRKGYGPFIHSVKIAAETEILQVVKKIFPEDPGFPEIFDILFFK